MTSDSKNRVVPWLSKQQWQHAYHLVFSEHSSDKQKGFQELLIWKSRVSKLPLGVECTLYLLQAILQEKCERSSDIELQLLYSTSIIRFINLISHLGQVDLRHQPISVIAELVGIPDWLVNIRHEATHAKMPALGVLRSGALVAMDWLEENYWQMEDEQSADVFWPETNKQGFGGKKAGTPIESAHSNTVFLYDFKIPEHIVTSAKMLLLLLQEMPTRQSLHQVASETVKQYAYKVWLQNKANAPSEDKSVKLYQPLKIINRLLVADLEQTVSEWVDIFIQKDPSLVNKQDAATLKGQVIAYALNSCWESLVELKPQPHRQKLLWKLLYRWNAAPFLIELLSMRDFENESQLNLCLSLISTLADSLQEGMNFDFQPTVRNLLMRPNLETLHILNKLEKFQTSVQESTAWGEMHELLKIRLQLGAPSNQLQKINHIFTLNMIKEASEISKKKPETAKHNALHLSDKGDVDTWTLCRGFDWSRVPIGSVANPCDGLNALELSNPEWEILEGRSDETSFRNSLKRGSERFDWNSLVRKRRRRGGLKDTRVGVSVY